MSNEQMALLINYFYDNHLSPITFEDDKKPLEKQLLEFDSEFPDILKCVLCSDEIPFNFKKGSIGDYGEAAGDNFMCYGCLAKIEREKKNCLQNSKNQINTVIR